MTSKIAVGIALALALSACATTNNKNNYETYLKTVQQIEANKTVSAEASRIAKSAEYAQLQEACKDSACVSNVAAFKALSDVVDSLASSQGNSSVSRVAAPQREPTFSEQLLSWASVLVPGITSYTSIHESNKTQRHLSDNQTIERQSQNDMWGSIVGTIGSTPSIVVGGNYGNTETNTAGTNLVSGSNNLIGDRNNNSGRQDSPGPFDDNSGDCRATNSCNTINPDPLS